MLNKIMVFGGLATAAILVVENMVMPAQAYVFIDNSSTTWFLAVVCIIVGVIIGTGLKGMFSDDSGDDDNYDF